jgi:type IV pilus assembly protein PilA
MKAFATGLVLAATMALVGCKSSKDAGGTSGASASSPGVTSPTIDSLLGAVPGNAIALGFVDMDTPPWNYVTGGAGLPLDEATRKTLDKELREYIDRFVGVDVSKLQYAVGFFAGPPPGGAILVKTIGGTPKLPGATDYQGGKLWVVDPYDHITVALKGDIAMVGTEDAVHGALDTLAGKRKSVAAENAALVDWLHKETKGAAVGFAAVAPKDLPLPSELAGLQRVAASASRTGVRAIVEGDDAAIGKLQAMADQGLAKLLAEVEQAHAAAVAGNLRPPEGAFAIISAAYAKDYAAKLKPRRDGNSLSTVLDLGAPGSEMMTTVSVMGIMAAVAIPAFMDYMKKSKKTEASLQLNKLGKSLRIYFITNAAFPQGDAPLTPAASCCAGPNHKCPADPANWQQPIWQALDFQIDEPHMFQYRYHSDGQTALVEAIGDLDCDGVQITYRMDMTAPAGNPSMMITEPPPNSD